MNPSIQEIRKAQEVVYASMLPTPQISWPLLCKELGTEVWLKQENHTPVGAFKIRGGLVYFADLAASGKAPNGVVCATRGNHGQSVGFAAKKYGIPATVVVPKGNSAGKNEAMRAFGVELVEHGDDFQESLEFAGNLAKERGLHMVPSFHPLLVAGVATYSLELFQAMEGLDTLYVPIGLGSGICGAIAARDALGLETEIVGVVSTHASAYAQSFKQKRLWNPPLAPNWPMEWPAASPTPMPWK